MTQIVLLTGASGFIAKHIALKLLNAGYAVRGTVRKLDRADEVRDAVRPHLTDPAALDRLSFVTLDLERDAGWAEALAGVDVLMHTASPFPIAQPRNEDALIRPAVDGTLRALRAAKAAGVKRVILTSSAAAVMGCDLPPGKAAYDEADWTDLARPGVSAYEKSKTMAERAAWDFIASEAPDMQMTTINPTLVLGPPLDRHFGSSISIIERILNGADPAIPNFGISCVDVRDVADMHLAALTQDGTAGERFLVSERFVWFKEVADVLRQAYPDRKIASWVAPDFLLRILALFDASIKALVPQLGRKSVVSSAKAQQIMGIRFIPVPESIRDAAQFLVDNKLVK